MSDKNSVISWTAFIIIVKKNQPTKVIKSLTKPISKVTYIYSQWQAHFLRVPLPNTLLTWRQQVALEDRLPSRSPSAHQTHHHHRHHLHPHPTILSASSPVRHRFPMRELPPLIPRRIRERCLQILIPEWQIKRRPRLPEQFQRWQPVRVLVARHQGDIYPLQVFTRYQRIIPRHGQLYSQAQDLL